MDRPDQGKNHSESTDAREARNTGQVHQHRAGQSGHAGHHHDHSDTGSTRLVLSIGLNLLITIVEIVGGIVSGSLALLSDALHNFTDTSSLAISYSARRLASRGANERMTFGYRRAELIGAFVNLLTLVLIAVWLVKEAVERLMDPQPIKLLPMLVVAAIGLAANLLTALLLHKPARDSINLRSAYLHIVMDAASSVGVIFGAIVIAWKGWLWVDPVLSVVIAAYIGYFSFSMLRRTGLVLMEATPADIEVGEVVKAIEAIDIVRDVHHVHVWQLDEKTVALEAHVCIADEDLSKMELTKQAIKKRVAEAFGIAHSTLEFETRPCGENESPLPDSGFDPGPCGEEEHVHHD